jgi:hydrogenase assembly chaperone HypC/HupF
MRNSQQEQSSTQPLASSPLISNQPMSYTCSHSEDNHCITCSDEAVPVRVLRVNNETDLALVEVGEDIEEIDITLVEDVTPGDMLLAHGGVAMAHLDERRNDGY